MLNNLRQRLAGPEISRQLQALAAGAVQRGVQALKHVGKTERALLLLELAQALGHAGGGGCADHCSRGHRDLVCAQLHRKRFCDGSSLKRRSVYV